MRPWSEAGSRCGGGQAGGIAKPVLRFGAEKTLSAKPVRGLASVKQMAMLAKAVEVTDKDAED